MSEEREEEKEERDAAPKSKNPTKMWGIIKAPIVVVYRHAPPRHYSQRIKLAEPEPSKRSATLREFQDKPDPISCKGQQKTLLR